MKERPILFSGPMVRAILDGRKTQTRRVIKPQPCDVDNYDGAALLCFDGDERSYHIGARSDGGFPCPYGLPGDRLWVRESWNAQFAWDDEEDDVPYAWAHETERRLRVESRCQRASYAADESSYWVVGGRHGICSAPLEAERYEAPPRWMPSIHMPRWASRLLLEITDVRVERVQEITPHDACAEGVHIYAADKAPDVSDVAAFRDLWDSLKAERGYGWGANPWVWALSFKRVDGEVSHG